MKIDIRKPLNFSELGCKENQEDAIYLSEPGNKQKFFILCDGMGGHAHGEVASSTVCLTLGAFLTHFFEENEIIRPEDFNDGLQAAYNSLDRQDNGEDEKKMGTTMTCLCLERSGYLVAHIGDSRIYHIRPSKVNIENGEFGIIYKSRDHSLVNDLIKVGELTEEEAKTFPQRNVITRAIQPNMEKRAKADVYKFDDIETGDYFFLCSDGILEQLTEEDLSRILSDNNLNDEEKINAIKDICEDSTRDNYTCILVPIDKVRKERVMLNDQDDEEETTKKVPIRPKVIFETEEADEEPVKADRPRYVAKRRHSYKTTLLLILLIGLVIAGFYYSVMDNSGDSIIPNTFKLDSLKNSRKETEDSLNRVLLERRKQDSLNQIKKTKDSIENAKIVLPGDKALEKDMDKAEKDLNAPLVNPKTTNTKPVQTSSTKSENNAKANDVTTEDASNNTVTTNESKNNAVKQNATPNKSKAPVQNQQKNDSKAQTKPSTGANNNNATTAKKKTPVTNKQQTQTTKPTTATSSKSNKTSAAKASTTTNKNNTKPTNTTANSKAKATNTATSKTSQQKTTTGSKNSAKTSSSKATTSSTAKTTAAKNTSTKTTTAAKSSTTKSATTKSTATKTTTAKSATASSSKSKSSSTNSNTKATKSTSNNKSTTSTTTKKK